MLFYSDSGYAVIMRFLTLFLKFGGFLLKVEVIFKILEVNFGILVEVICPASKSQCWSVLSHKSQISTLFSNPIAQVLNRPKTVFLGEKKAVFGEQIWLAWEIYTSAPVPVSVGSTNGSSLCQPCNIYLVVITFYNKLPQKNFTTILFAFCNLQ